MKIKGLSEGQTVGDLARQGYEEGSPAISEQPWPAEMLQLEGPAPSATTAQLLERRPPWIQLKNRNLMILVVGAGAGLVLLLLLFYILFAR